MLDFNSVPRKDRIIVALDCDRSRALELADMLAGKAKWIKIGMTLFYQEGPYFINALHNVLSDTNRKGLITVIPLGTFRMNYQFFLFHAKSPLC